jgi:hypothetical protein
MASRHETHEDRYPSLGDMLMRWREEEAKQAPRRIMIWREEQAKQAHKKEAKNPKPCPISKHGEPCTCPQTTPQPSQWSPAHAESTNLGSAALGGTPDSSTPAPNLGAIGSKRRLAEPSGLGSAALGGTPEPSPPRSNLPAIGSERARAHAQGQRLSPGHPDYLTPDARIYGVYY